MTAARATDHISATPVVGYERRLMTFYDKFQWVGWSALGQPHAHAWGYRFLPCFAGIVPINCTV